MKLNGHIWFFLDIPSLCCDYITNCSACNFFLKDGKQSENSAMNMTKNGIFYKIHFQSNISLENKKCDGKVEISCMTGSTDIPMYSASVKYCQRK